MAKPIIFFDLETTGTDVVKDRIVQLAVMMCHSLSDTEGLEKCILVNPGIPISPEATEVHGITDAMVKDKPSFSQYAKSIFEMINGCDYGGFNIIQFDVPILSEEFARCGIEWPQKDALFFDAFHVFREKEKRDLTSALKFYCKEDYTNAHDALEDIRATRKVLLSQMQQYDDLRTIEQYGSFCNNPNALDLASKIILNENGEPTYNFGPHKGKTVKSEPSFASWMLNPKQTFSTNTKNVLRSILDI